MLTFPIGARFPVAALSCAGASITVALLGAAPARAASALSPCAASARPFAATLRALKGQDGTLLSIAVSSRTPNCTVPAVFGRVEVRSARDKRVRVYTNVRASGGRASIHLRGLRQHESLTVRLVVRTRQTVEEKIVRGRTRVLRLPDLVVRLVAPRQALRDEPFSVGVTVRELYGDFGATASLQVGVGATTNPPATIAVRAGGSTTVSYPVTLGLEGGYPIVARISDVTPAETRTDNDEARGRVEITSFRVDEANVVVPGLAGYGAQFNQNVYAAISKGVGVTEENVKVMEDRIVALHPHFVRLFLNPNVYVDADLMQSFVRSVQLAQRAGATINVTWQAGGTNDPPGSMLKFANTLADLVTAKGVTGLRWVTVQNEVNSTRITMQQYEQFYRLLDADLTKLGVRDRIRFMGGDLVGTVSPLGQTQDEWFAFMASNMADLLDAWSVHIFWDYWDRDKLVRRLTEVRAIWDALPASGRKPLYVTEYSPRGIRAPTGPPDPGAWDDGTPLAQTNINAFQHAWFDVLSSKLGYYGTSKWDAYFGKYDRATQAYYMIGSPQEGWPVRPTYNLLKLFTSTTSPGWNVVAVDGSYGNALVTAYVGSSGQETLIGLDTDGGSLNAPSETQISYSLGGLPRAAALTLLVWNLDGSGALAPPQSVKTDAAGVLTVSIPLHAVFALTASARA